MSEVAPGPWTYERYGAQWQIEGDGGRVLVADTYLSEAHARLIAAAPDLLAACKRLEEAMDDHMSGQEVAQEVKIRRDMVRAAVAKASVLDE